MGLIACDNNSLKYAKILELTKMKCGKWHKCNCGLCKAEEAIQCPHCGKTSNENWYGYVHDYDEWIGNDSYDILSECPDCGGVFVRDNIAMVGLKNILKSLEIN